MTSLEALNVSRETIDQLRAFEALVQKWSPKINLVSKAELPRLWDRHIVDSAQLFQHAPDAGHWLDIGSGGGFPGVITAILSQGLGRDHQFTLVESDQRKCAFLRTAGRTLGLEMTVRSERIESATPLHADILSARALANLTVLLGFADRHLVKSGVALFPKGESWQKEHQSAQDVWSYRCEPIKSETNAAAAVLKIQDITRV
jgi:16S rRNA (guanine527-N7)-methyltransferase